MINLKMRHTLATTFRVLGKIDLKLFAGNKLFMKNLPILMDFSKKERRENGKNSFNFSEDFYVFRGNLLLFRHFGERSHLIRP